MVTNYKTEITLLHVQHGDFGHAMPTAMRTRAPHMQASTPDYLQEKKKREEKERCADKKALRASRRKDGVIITASGSRLFW